MTFDSAGDLYGVTQLGGGTGFDGTVFELKPAAGEWTETILHRFNTSNGDGTLPQAGVIFDSFGNIYGTTYGGGMSHSGVAFKLAPNGSGAYTESAVHQFTAGNDGANPSGSLIMDPLGNLYGTTSIGGNAFDGNEAFGTVFALTPLP